MMSLFINFDAGDAGPSVYPGPNSMQWAIANRLASWRRFSKAPQPRLQMGDVKDACLEHLDHLGMDLLQLRGLFGQFAVKGGPCKSWNEVPRLHG
jgi:hypothetical protein